VSLLIGVSLSVVGYLLMPKPKAERPPSVDDLEEPTAEAGRPIPVVFGSVTIKGLNVLWYGDKSVRDRRVKQRKK
jgi:hypothetical protein